MSYRTKLPPSKKIELVESYLAGEKSLLKIAKEYGIARQTFQGWVRLYNTRGNEGLIPSAKQRTYSAETKLRAVQDYMSGAGSLSDICIKYDISNHAMVYNWLSWYNRYGTFKQPSSVEAIRMTKGRSTTLEERIEIVGHCIANNKDYSKTTRQYGVSYQQVYGWVKKYEMDGIDGLVDHRGKRKSEASLSEVEKLRAQLKLKDAENLRLQMENDLLKKLEALERGRNA